MNRKGFLKNISAVGAIIVLPRINFANTPKLQTNFHFIGLGDGGTNALVTFSKKNINGTFTAVNESFDTEILKNKNIDCFYFKNDENSFLSLMKLRKKLFDDSSTENKKLVYSPTFEEADNHTTFYDNKSIQKRVNAACFIIYNET